MKSKSKSKLRIEIKVYLRDTNRTGEQQRQNMIWFAKQIGLGESTLHDRLNLPDKFEPVELEKIAELLDLDIESVRRLSYDFASVIPSELINETPSEIGENKVVSVERKELTQGSLKSKRAKKVLLLGGAGLFMFSNAAFIGMDKSDSSISMPVQRVTKPVYIAHYQGSGIDLSTSDMSQLNSFHSQLYRYEFNNIRTSTIGEDITLDGEIVWVDVKNKMRSNAFKINAHGKHLGDTAALSYKVHSDPEMEVWVGTMMLHMPRSGPATGYWMTIHHDKDPAKTGPFSMGTINVDRITNIERHTY